MGYPNGWTDGVPRADRIRLLGNAIVPQAGAIAAQRALVILESSIFAKLRTQKRK